MCLHVDDGDGVVVLIGHIEISSAPVEREKLWVRTGGQVFGHLVGLGVDHLDGVIVAHRHQTVLVVGGQLDAARALPDLDGLDDRHLVGVDDADGVASLVRDVGLVRVRRAGERDNEAKSDETGAPHMFPTRNNILVWQGGYCSLHLVSGRS